MHTQSSPRRSKNRKNLLRIFNEVCMMLFLTDLIEMDKPYAQVALLMVSQMSVQSGEKMHVRRIFWIIRFDHVRRDPELFVEIFLKDLQDRFEERGRELGSLKKLSRSHCRVN